MKYSSTALVVVDMQYGDAHRDYGLLKDKRAAGDIDTVESYARRLDEIVVPNIQRILQEFRGRGGEVIFIRIESLTFDGRDRSPEHVRRGIHFPPGSKEGEILEEIRPCDDEPVLSKTCGSAFRGTNVEYLLRNMERTNVVVVGVVTGSCVQATTCDALDHGFATVVVDDATATWNAEMQTAALSVMRSRGATVLTTDALLGTLEP